MQKRDRLLWSVLIACIVISMLMLPFAAHVAKADYSWDFSGGAQGWVVDGDGVFGTTCGIAPGANPYFESVPNSTCADGQAQSLGIMYDFGGTVTITSISIHWESTENINSGVRQLNNQDSTYLGALDHFSGDHNTDTVNFGGGVSLSKIYIILTNGGAGSGGTTKIHSVSVVSTYSGPTSTPTPTITLTPTPGPSPTPGPLVAPGCTTGWSEVDDFTQSTWNWTSSGYSPAWVQNTGFPAGPSSNGNGTFSNKTIISRTLLFDHLTRFDLDFSYRPGNAGSNDLRGITVDKDGYVFLNVGGSPPTPGHRTATWTGDLGSGLYTVTIYVSGEVTDPIDAADGSATIIKATMTGEGGQPTGFCNPSPPSGGSEENIWAYPIKQSQQYLERPFRPLVNTSLSVDDQDPFLQFGQNQAIGDTFKAIEGITRNSDIKIHSMTSGTVANVTPLDGGASPCSQQIPVLTIDSPPFTCPFNGTDLSNGTKDGGEISYENVSLIEIDGPQDTHLFYIVRDAKVDPGQQVSQGCILGLALKLYAGNWSFGTGGPSSNGFDQRPWGYTFIQTRDQNNFQFDPTPFLQLEPADLSCSAGGGGGVSGCIYVQDANFLDDTLFNWKPLQSTDGNPQNPPGESQGLYLRNNTGAKQSLPLDATVQYTITIRAHQITPSPNGSINHFVISLGAGPSINPIAVGGGSQEETVIPADTYMPSSADGFMLVISATNDTASNIVVDFACVSDNTSGPPLPSGGCLFQNPEFDTDTAWTKTDGGHGTPSIAAGVAVMPNSGVISQSVTLHPQSGGDQDYTITLSGRRDGAGGTLSIGWVFGSHSGTLGSYTGAGFTDDTDTFTVSSDETHTFTLTATTDDNAHKGQIDRVCIETTDGVDAPGYQHAGNIPFTASCKVCSYVPIGDVNYDLPEVIAWLFCALSQIWNCQAKAILYGIWQTAVNILAFLGMMRLWTGLTISSLTVWTDANIQIFARYLNGLLNNLAVKLISGLGGVHSEVAPQSNIFDVLIALFRSLADIINQLIHGILELAKLLVELVLGILTLIFNLIFLLIGQILGFIRLLMAFIFDVINSPPTLPAGLPICDTGASTIPESCVPIFMLDHTVFAEASPFAFIIQILEGSVFFLLLWWAIQTLRGTLTE